MSEGGGSLQRSGANDEASQIAEGQGKSVGCPRGQDRARPRPARPRPARQDPRSKTARKQSLRAKAERPGSAPSSREPLDHFIDAAAHALALPIEPAWKGAIRTNLAVTLALAASFAEFPLPDDAEPAPVFVA